MKILITSGNSFLGGRISEGLLELGHQITLGYRKESKINSVKFKKFLHKEINWECFNSLRNACQNMDVVIHTAGISSKDCSKDFNSALNFNSLISGQLGIACAKEKVKLFIYLSSIHVYANNIKGIVHENCKTEKKDCYTSSKILAENIYRDLSYEKHTKFIILRLSNIFGYPFSKYSNCWDLFINNICKEAITKRTITIKSNPLLTRNFISAEYFISSLKHVIKNNKKYKYFEVLNISSKKNYSLEEIANIIREKISSFFNTKILIINNEEKSKTENKIYSSKIKIENKCDPFFEKEIDKLISYCKNEFTR